jgi:hypothetical protein
MAGDFSIRAVNNWRAEMHASMSDALRVSRDVFNRNAAQATKHMIIVMAQSARAMTKQSPGYRPSKTDEHGEYVERWDDGKVSKIYRWMFSQSYLEREAASRGYGGEAGMRRYVAGRGTWEGATTIRNRGLAKRSWMWGLSGIRGDIAGYMGAGAAKRAIPGVSVGSEIRRGSQVVGHMITNRLGYLLKILPSGWQAAVEQKAVNKVMKQAEMKMVKEFERDIGRRAA